MKRYRELSALLLVMVMIGCLVGCGKGQDTAVPGSDSVSGGEKTYRVAYVADTGLDVYEWLAQTVKNLQSWADETSYIEEIKFVEAADAANYEPMIRALCEEKYDVIITNFASHADATKKLAQEYPDIKFAILDAGFTEEELSKYSNLMEFGLERAYNAFLAGIVAASMTETGKVGFIGGADNAALSWILAGWQQGLHYVNPDIEDYVVWENNWTDANVGKEYANSLINRGCDVLIASAGGTETGIAQACSDNQTFFIAMDTHYYDYVKGLELGCAGSNIGKMCESVYDNAINGEFPAGQVVYYGGDYGVVWFEFSEESPVPDGVRKLVEEVSEKVESGEIILEKEPIHK